VVAVVVVAHAVLYSETLSRGQDAGESGFVRAPKFSAAVMRAQARRMRGV
jgi:hypothetical protein